MGRDVLTTDDLSTVPIVSRDDLREIVRHAANATKRLTLAERHRLSSVAKQAALIAYQDWQVGGVGCPLVQANIPREYGEEFSRLFDSAMHDLLRELHYDADTPQVLTIVP